MQCVKPLVAFIVFLYSASSTAGSIPCSGAIDMLFVKRTGEVELYSSQLYGNGIGRTICNTANAWKGITPDTCKVWYSNMLSSSAQSKPVVLYYLDSEVSSCGNVQSYNDSPAPFGVADKLLP